MAAARTKKKASSKRTESPFASLPDGIRAALAMATDQVFFENVEEAVEDPLGLARDKTLGSTYQGYYRGLLTVAESAARLDELASWVEARSVVALLKRAGKDKSASLTDFACDLVDAAVACAGVDFARAILLIAAESESEVPERVRPHLAPLQALAKQLADAIERGDTSERQDLVDLVTGGG